MFRHTRKKARTDAICAKMREGKASRREDRIRELGRRPPTYVPPELRRVVVVIDYDLDKVDVFRLQRTERIDTLAVSHNSNEPERMGWSSFCKRLSCHYPRLLSPYAE